MPSTEIFPSLAVFFDSLFLHFDCMIKPTLNSHSTAALYKYSAVLYSMNTAVIFRYGRSVSGFLHQSHLKNAGFLLMTYGVTQKLLFKQA